MISLKNAYFSYENKEILKDFTLDISTEGITALSGPSGCGKTTLLRLISGLESLQNGYIFGINPKNAGYLFQENRLLPWRTVGQHITDVLPRGEKDPRKYLEMVELAEEENAYPDALSGGMGRRLALARCIALKSQLILLDEPFTGVDPERAARILERLRSMGTPMILATHQHQIMEMADNIIVLSGPPLACN